jgi:cytochrome c nitrite reductase small subunit
MQVGVSFQEDSMNLLKPLLAAAVLLGAAVGIGGYTFVYAHGASYLSNNPSACANCHVMSDHYSAWIKSSHQQVATCNDCHTPPGGVIGKYATKAANGFLHSYAFTTGNYPDPMQIRGFNAEVTESACRNCHVVAETIANTAHSQVGSDSDGGISCVKCHRSVGHWVR